MPAPRIVRLPLLLAAQALVLLATPAHAEALQDNTVGVLARAHVSFLPITGGWKVCGDGSFPASSVVTGTWALTVGGARDGVPFSEGPQTGTGLTARLCTEVMRESTTGFAVGTLTYTAAGSYVAAFSLQGFTWEPNTGMHPFGVDPRP